MSSITINIPSEFLVLDFWKTHWFYIYLPIHVLYAWVHHFAALPSIKRWNALSDCERKTAGTSGLRNSIIGPGFLLFMFVLTTIFYFPARVAYFYIRILLIPLLTVVSLQLQVLPSWNVLFSIPHPPHCGLPGRFAVGD